MFPANISTAFQTRKDDNGQVSDRNRSDGRCQRERLTGGSEGKSGSSRFLQKWLKNGLHNELYFRLKGPDFKQDFYKIFDFVAA